MDMEAGDGFIHTHTYTHTHTHTHTYTHTHTQRQGKRASVGKTCRKNPGRLTQLQDLQEAEERELFHLATLHSKL